MLLLDGVRKQILDYLTLEGDAGLAIKRDKVDVFAGTEFRLYGAFARHVAWWQI
jgi:hypothetical protein